MKAHPGMRIRELDRLERGNVLDHDAQFLVKFPRQRLVNAFSGLDLAARKLPPARIGLALGALRKEERTIRAPQDPNSHLDRRSGIGV